MKSWRILFLLSVTMVLVTGNWASGAEFRVGTFTVDATPPIGSPLAYDPMKEVVMPLSCKGVVLLGDDKPIVLCAVDWIGIGNDGNKIFRKTIAEQVGTTVDRVAVHTVHQHDAPTMDLSAEELLAEQGLSGTMFNVEHVRKVMQEAAEAARQAATKAESVTEIGLGEGMPDRVASNRRIQGADGNVQWTRYTSGGSQQRNRLAPIGLIDPMLKIIVFYHEDRPLAALTYYACHPQSYYRTGGANPDFPGMARQMREEATGVVHIHFDGAGGNIGAGKWNDGSPPYRKILADRMAKAMEDAWNSVERWPVTADDLGWKVAPVCLPLADHVKPDELESKLKDPNVPAEQKPAIAKALAWARRCVEKDPIVLQCLRLGPARVVHMPGELFVEYQLAAQQLRPDLFVAMAAYGDYACGYIGTEISYSQGGYEVSERASRVGPGSEEVLMSALRSLLLD